MSAYRPISAQLDRTASGVIPERWPRPAAFFLMSYGPVSAVSRGRRTKLRTQTPAPIPKSQKR